MDDRLHSEFLDARGMEIADLEKIGECLATWQRGLNWWIGDVARYAESRWPDKWHQVFPDWVSPGLIDRCKAVAKAYPKESDRVPGATWTQHMQVANDRDRRSILEWMVEEGLTSDEAREKMREIRALARKKPQRWLLAFDVNYFLHRFWFSGAGVESASGVSSWIARTTERLREKGLTDVACCFDSKRNHRKELTANWEHKYKDRPTKEVELGQQLDLVRELLEGQGFACISVDGMEGDDVMASLAKQFGGRVTLVTQDKDCRQCLSQKCNILLDVEWHEDPTSGKHLPDYKWLSASEHREQTGIPPEQWTQYQALMGDTVDGIKGAIGIGAKGAKDLIHAFGTAAAAIEAAKAEDESIPPKKRQALIEFESKLDTTLQLVTLRTDLDVSVATRIPEGVGSAETTQTQ